MQDPNQRDINLTYLHPSFRAKVQAVLDACTQEQLPFRVFEGFRSPQRQQYLFDQGRNRPGNKVTNARPWTSYHQYGLAADYVIYENNRWSWESRGEKAGWWKRLHEIGRAQGLEPLSWETPHLQLPSLKGDVLWGLSRTNLSGRRYDAALTTVEKLTSDHTDSTYAARAYFLMGQAYSKSGKYAQAANAYNTYLAKVPGVLDSYVQELRGDSFAADQNNTDALTAYNAALAAPHLAEREVDLQIKAAQARAAIGDYAGALMIYNDFAANSPDDYVKSQMDYLAGKAHLSLEQSDEGYGLFRHAVENYPLSYYSYLALVELSTASRPPTTQSRAAGAASTPTGCRHHLPRPAQLDRGADLPA